MELAWRYTMTQTLVSRKTDRQKVFEVPITVGEF